MRVPQKGDFLTLASNAAYFPHALDLERREIVFVPTTRDILSSSAFIDGRTSILQNGKAEIRVSIEDALKAAEASTPILGFGTHNYIFHTGFCCSTLVAKCLDLKGACVSLKEPNILNNLSDAKRLSLEYSKNQKSNDQVLKMILALLFRRFSKNEAVLVKPTNANNNLIEDILRVNPGGKILFISSDLKSFLISVAKGGQPRRDTIRRLVSMILMDFKNNLPPGENVLPFSENTLWNMSDLHIAAVAWRLQMQRLENIEKRFSAVQIKKMDCEEFLANPAKTTAHLADFFDINLGKVNRQKGWMEKNMSTHAKAPEFSYSVTIRQTEFMAIENYLGKTLDEVLAWVDDFLAPENSPHLPKVAI